MAEFPKEVHCRLKMPPGYIALTKDDVNDLCNLLRGMCWGEHDKWKSIEQFRTKMLKRFDE